MVDRDLLLDGLSALWNAKVTSIQKTQTACSAGACVGGPVDQLLLVTDFVSSVLAADETCQVSRSNFVHLQSVLGGDMIGGSFRNKEVDAPTGHNIIIDEDQFFDPQYDFDFTNVRDQETYYRGGEVYERPCGWQRYALKVKDKYTDGDTWLGHGLDRTQSEQGEWPVSYHATSREGAQGIIEGFYKPGPRQAYGRGVYSTPYIKEALAYAKTFHQKKTGKKFQIILQNRINPAYRQKHKNEKYWLIPIPEGTSDEAEKATITNAIRPYSILMRQV